jgi:hypothetical protein
MPELRPGFAHYAIATRTILHGSPVVQDGIAGIAVKQGVAPGGTGLGSSLINTIQVTERYVIWTAGEAVLDNPGDALEPGDAVYVSADGDLWPLAGVNEVQRITVVGTGGTFTLTFDGEETSALDFDSTNAEIEAALEALSNLAPADVAVTGTGPFSVTFAGAYADTDVPAMTADDALLTGPGAAVTITTLTAGQEAASKLRRPTRRPTSRPGCGVRCGRSVWQGYTASSRSTGATRASRTPGLPPAPHPGLNALKGIGYVGDHGEYPG